MSIFFERRNSVYQARHWNRVQYGNREGVDCKKSGIKI
jgi:hypothetical protein